MKYYVKFYQRGDLDFGGRNVTVINFLPIYKWLFENKILFDLSEKWFCENDGDDCYSEWEETTITFKSKQDAALFKLSWC